MILSASVLPDELLAVATSYDQTGRYGAQTPFNDQLASHWEAGKWEVDGTHDSFVTVTNGGNKPELAQLTILYNQGKGQYVIEKTLAPDEQMLLDFGKLIHDQVPDKSGQFLLPDLTTGAYRILDLTDHAAGGLYEGKVIVDKRYGHAAYGCGICCGPNNPYMLYDPLILPVLGSSGQQINAVNSCTRKLINVTGDFPTWWTNNTSIATASGSQINGVAVGSTNDNGQSILMYFGPSVSAGGQPCPQDQAAPSGGTNVRPTISGPNTLWWFNGLSAGVAGYSNQITLTASSGGNGTSYQWAISADSTKVSLSPSTSATVQVTSIGQSTTANDVSITVTVGGQTSSPFNLTVRAPYTLGTDPNHPTPVYGQDPQYVWNIYIYYYILDNQLTPMSTSVSANENWTSGAVSDYPNETWGIGVTGCGTTSSSTPAEAWDFIQGAFLGNYPAPVYNTQQNGPAVVHWGEEIRVGTCTIGAGPRVQTNTLQKYTDHAAHTGITTPAP